MTIEDLVKLGTEIVGQAKGKDLVIRLIGGIAVYARCPSVQSHLKLQRTYKDLDLIASSDAWGALPQFFGPLGFKLENSIPARMTFTQGDLTVDVRGTDFRDSYSFNFASRLVLDDMTLPLADLLLLKLQRSMFADKDIQDSIALLLDHRVGDDGDQETVDRVYIYKLTNRNWGLWNTVFDNTVTLEKILDRYIDPEEAQLVWRRIELIQEVLDGKEKSLGWWLRATPKKNVKRG